MLKYLLKIKSLPVYFFRNLYKNAGQSTWKKKNSITEFLINHWYGNSKKKQRED
jgi:hypothetical protein